MTYLCSVCGRRFQTFQVLAPEHERKVSPIRSDAGRVKRLLADQMEREAKAREQDPGRPWVPYGNVPGPNLPCSGGLPSLGKRYS